MSKQSTFWIIIILAIVVVGGVYWYVQGGPGEEGAESQTTQMAEHPVTMPASTHMSDVQYVQGNGNLLLGTEGNAKSGTYLIGFNGMALYTFANDTATASNCTGACASIWPPYIVADSSALGNIQKGIPGKVGTVVRPNGALQVTYNGKPLYFYANDKTTSDTTGNGVKGVWHLATP